MVYTSASGIKRAISSSSSLTLLPKFDPAGSSSSYPGLFESLAETFSYPFYESKTWSDLGKYKQFTSEDSPFFSGLS